MFQNSMSTASSKNTTYQEQPLKSYNESSSINPINITTPNNHNYLEVFLESDIYS
jgi:hypothetical protein